MTETISPATVTTFLADGDGFPSVRDDFPRCPRRFPHGPGRFP